MIADQGRVIFSGKLGDKEGPLPSKGGSVVVGGGWGARKGGEKSYLF